jgi:SAM-dependent methyltransferase
MKKQIQSEFCEICGSVSPLLCHRMNYSYFRCPTCKLIFLSPLPPPSDLEELYLSQEPVVFGEDKKLRTLIKRIEKHLGAEEISNVLDIGSQNGTFLDNLSSLKNLRLYGVEPSRPAFEASSKNPRLSIKHGFFSTEDYPEEFFELVNLGDVIEHVENSVEMVKDVRTVMSKTGLFVISTPVSDCLYVRTSNFFNRLLGDFFPNAYLTPPYHVRYFDSRSLDELLFENGFKKLEGWYMPSNFRYELGESQILFGFRSKSLQRKISPLFIARLLVFSSVYLFSRILTKFSFRDFSYTAIYQLNED